MCPEQHPIFLSFGMNVSNDVWHPASSYVQGINDLATPLVAVFLSDYHQEEEILDGAAMVVLAEERLEEVVWYDVVGLTVAPGNAGCSHNSYFRSCISCKPWDLMNSLDLCNKFQRKTGEKQKW
jgi:hypothetical protein